MVVKYRIANIMQQTFGLWDIVVKEGARKCAALPR
jgi:hypothetical protein